MQFLRLIAGLLLILFIYTPLTAQNVSKDGHEHRIYRVRKLKGPMQIDANWNKREWKNADVIKVNNFIRENPIFKPEVTAKMLYDTDNLYVIFLVNDRFVRSITTKINGPVWKDSAVEFFFSPDITDASSYFNLEVNCGGTPLLGYKSSAGVKPAIEDIRQIEIAHSLPETVDPEIREPVSWVVEYRIPFNILHKYSAFTNPKEGVEWRANFYKIAENNSNPHHASWSPINHPKPTFHLPEFFGTLIFK